jgi:hypothetical protein
VESDSGGVIWWWLVVKKVVVGGGGGGNSGGYGGGCGGGGDDDDGRWRAVGVKVVVVHDGGRDGGGGVRRYLCVQLCNLFDFVRSHLSAVASKCIQHAHSQQCTLFDTGTSTAPLTYVRLCLCCWHHERHCRHMSRYVCGGEGMVVRVGVRESGVVLVLVVVIMLEVAAVVVAVDEGWRRCW